MSKRESRSGKYKTKLSFRVFHCRFSIRFWRFDFRARYIFGPLASRDLPHHAEGCPEAALNKSLKIGISLATDMQAVIEGIGA